MNLLFLIDNSMEVLMKLDNSFVSRTDCFKKEIVNEQPHVTIDHLDIHVCFISNKRYVLQ